MAQANAKTRLLIATCTTLAIALGTWFAQPYFAYQYRTLQAKRLANQITTADDASARLLLRQLITMGDPANAHLVAAASSRRAVVASIARQHIDRQLAIWSATVSSTDGDQSSDLARASLVQLSESLAAHVKGFGPSGQQWAESITMRLIDLAEILPSNVTFQLLENCSAALAAIPPRGPQLRSVASLEQGLPALPERELTSPQPPLESLTRASDSALDILPRIAPRSDSTMNAPRQPVTPSEVPIPSTTSSSLNWQTRTPPRVAQREPPPVSTPDEASLKNAIPLPTATNSTLIDVPTPDEMAATAESLQPLTTDELLVRLRGALVFEAGVIRSVLSSRGYSLAEQEMMIRSKSPQAVDRLQLVTEAAKLPAAAARRLLQRLLRDTDGDVRLQALTALAAANSPGLNELARELAIHDEDQRVARLASKLLKK